MPRTPTPPPKEPPQETRPPVMWEVSWDDPQRESRKEHRERKSSRRAQEPKKSRTSVRSKLGRRPASVESKSSSGHDFSETDSIDHGLGIAAASLRAARYCSSKAASILSSDIDIDIDKCSSMSTCSDVVEVVTPDLSCTPTSTVECANPHDYFTTSPESSVPRRDRGLHLAPSGAWLDPSMLSPPPSPSSAWHLQPFDPVAYISANYIQTIGADSFITKRTRVTVSPRTVEDTTTKMGSQITITANKFDEPPPQRPSTAGTMYNVIPIPPDAIGPPEGLVSKPTAKSLRRIPSCTSSICTTKWDGWRPPDAWA